MIKKYKYRSQGGFVVWLVASLIFFILALLVQHFSLLSSKFSSENDKDQLFYWANLIYERAERKLHRHNLSVNDVANWKFSGEQFAASGKCLYFSEVYQQKRSSEVLNSEDFYPPQIKHWNRINKSSQKQINNKYKNYCYKISQELVATLDGNLSETHDPNLLVLIINVTDKGSNSEYVKRGFISSYKWFDNYEI